MHNLDAPLIEATIGIAALCASCIMRIGELRASQLIDALPPLIGSLRIASAAGACSACLTETVVHRRT